MTEKNYPRTDANGNRYYLMCGDLDNKDDPEVEVRDTIAREYPGICLRLKSRRGEITAEIIKEPKTLKEFNLYMHGQVDKMYEEAYEKNVAPYKNYENMSAKEQAYLTERLMWEWGMESKYIPPKESEDPKNV